MLVNDDNSCRIINDFENDPIYTEYKQKIERIKAFDSFDDTRWEEYHKSIDYTKGAFEKVKLANGDSGDYLIKDENTKPLFDEAEYALDKAKVIEPEYTDTIKEIKSLFNNASLDLLDNEDKQRFRSKSIQSLANKIFNKNKNEESFTALKSKDFYRDTLLVNTNDITIDNLKLIYQIAEKHSFKSNLEIKTPRGNNAYYGIHFQFTKDGITTELQVSCDDLYKTKNITEKMYKQICSLDNKDPKNKIVFENNYKESLELYQKVLDGNPSLKSLFASSSDIERVSSSWDKLVYVVNDDGLTHEVPLGKDSLASGAPQLSLYTYNAPLSDGLKNNNSSPSLNSKSDISNSSSNDHSISQSDSDYEQVKVDDKGDIVDDAIFTQYKKTEIDRNIERNPTSKLVKEASKGKTISVYLSRKMIKTLSDHFATLMYYI